MFTYYIGFFKNAELFAALIPPRNACKNALNVIIET